jgi:hypothetical protein
MSKNILRFPQPRVSAEFWFSFLTFSIYLVINGALSESIPAVLLQYHGFTQSFQDVLQ